MVLWVTLKKILIFFLLTFLTQIGGLVYLLYLGIKKHIKLKRLPQRITLFFGLYLTATLAVTPLLAPCFGRIPLPLYATKEQPIQPASWLGCLMNRHYVKPELKMVLIEASKGMGEEVQLVYLDASFPFWDGFPLFPHKSHDDGKKVDLAFIYQSSEDQQLLNDGKGLLGYGVVEPPEAGEVNQPGICIKRGYWQYSLLEKLMPQSERPAYIFSEALNRQLLLSLASDKRVGKIFLEPHLKSRLGLEGYQKIRFHGCGAVRHDDHIHVQL